MAFRTTPLLGPALTANDPNWYLPPETYNDGSGVTDNAGVSYPLGTVTVGNDGYHYVLVQAGEELEADDIVTISAAWEATVDSGGAYVVAADIDGVVADEGYLHVRKITEGYEDAN